MRDALQAGMHADSKFKSRQKMNAAKNIQGLNNISAERLVSPIWARFSRKHSASCVFLSKL